VDVQYDTAGATAACIIAPSWTAAEPAEEQTVRLPAAPAYRPGELYLRELPCLIAVLAGVRSAFAAIVVDGYVDLDAVGTPGLGGRLHRHFDGRFPVIGVAKSEYRSFRGFAEQVVRGSGQRPLFVTARGVSAVDAARWVGAMHGDHRIPTLLRRVDRIARAAALAPPASKGRGH